MKLIIASIGLSGIYFLIGVYLVNDAKAVFILSIFLGVGVYFLLYSGEFIAQGESLDAEIKGATLSQIDGNGDGVKSVTKKYTFYFRYSDAPVTIEADSMTKFNYSTGDVVSILFLKQQQRAMLRKDVYLRLIVGMLIVSFTLIFLPVGDI